MALAWLGLYFFGAGNKGGERGREGWLYIAGLGD